RRPAEPHGSPARSARLQPAGRVSAPAIPLRVPDRARALADRRRALPPLRSGRSLAWPGPRRASGRDAMTVPALAAHGVVVRFGGLTAVDGVDLEIEDRTLVGIIGPNGAGKTTFFNALSGLVTPAAGRLVGGGADLTRKPAHVLARAGAAGPAARRSGRRLDRGGGPGHGPTGSTLPRRAGPLGGVDRARGGRAARRGRARSGAPPGQDARRGGSRRRRARPRSDRGLSRS